MGRRQAISEHWGTKVGVILAVMGSAVGLGNFLRFPGLAAKYGGGVFLVPYLIAFLVVGLPLAWAEWALGRYGGSLGHNSAPGIMRAITGRRGMAYVGMLGTLMPVMIYTYYVFVEAWCLAYAWDYLTGSFIRLGGDSAAITAHFLSSVGAESNGAMFSGTGSSRMLAFLTICFVINFFLIFRGIKHGIEKFCNLAMPLLVVCALVVLVRVLTLPANPAHPEQSLVNGLGYMWNPTRPGESFWMALARPDIWLAATGQIFFSLSVGFGLILTYASYLRRDDDVALGSLTAAAGNEFCEVALGGMIAIPAAFIFLGPAVVQDPPGTFGMGFITLPNVFNEMPAGNIFGFIFFALLFLAAITSSLSMLQPTIALLEEGVGLGRKAAVTVLGFVTLVGCLFIVYFSEGFVALDTIDFWMANFFIFVFATVQVLVFGWLLGVDRGMDELSRGAAIRLPRGLGFMLKYISPLYLLTIFVAWVCYELPARIRAMKPPAEGPPVVLMSVVLIAIVGIFFALLVSVANRRWDQEEAAP